LTPSTVKQLINTIVDYIHSLKGKFYLPFGLGGLLPLPPPDGLPVVLGALTGFDVDLAIMMKI
jgi:hypothetical protein